MIKKMHRCVLGLIVLALMLSAMICANVYAEENPNKCSAESLQTRYSGLKFDIDGSNVTIYANGLNKNLNGVEFELYRINNVSLDQTVTVVSDSTEKANSKNSKTVSVDPTRYGVSNDVATLYFRVSNDTTAGCNNIEYKKEIEGIGRQAKTEDFPEPSYDFGEIKYGEELNCDLDYSDDNFKASICKVRKIGKDNDPTKSALFKCNYSSTYTSNDLKGECYYKDENTSYLYHKEEKEVEDLGSYYYHLSPGTKPKEVSLSCTQVCEEAVEVKYGPPVASKAGMCFEYKVKVVSRVNCHAKSEIPKPTNYSVCTPYPICSSGSATYNNGGPNEEFDSCIKSCDNGKYTKSCSKKCYKKVYGKTNKLNNSLALNYATKLSDSTISKETCAKNNNTCNGNNCHGCYYKDGDSVKWYAQNTSNINISLGTCRTCGSGYDTPYAPGRWYYYNSWGNTAYYSTQSDGIFKAPDCTDVCSWEGCSGDVYLNGNMRSEDYETNKVTYENAVKKCKAAASCSQSTATFTIKAGHRTNCESDIKWIEFPYDKQTDYIKSSPSDNFISWTKENENTTLIDDKYDCKSSSGACTSCLSNCASNDTACKDACLDKKCDVLPDNGNRGCYDPNTNKTDRYRATWTFPYTYINLKTGEVSYGKPNNTSAWFKESKKFCIPLDADDINQSWWDYYYSKVTENNSNYSTKVDGSLDGITDDNIDWNIVAETKGFGYFKWNIKINCFYALHSKEKTCTSTTPGSGDGDALEKVRVRSVKLDNMFPASTGEEGSRDPGFNWSTYANTSQKNPNYASTPVELTDYIENHSSELYSDEYLDYQFVLTKNTLKEMRKEVEKNGLNYTNYDNDKFTVGDSTGISRYTSSKIRSIPGNNKIPNSSALKCNNMVNYSSSDCADLSK